MPLTAGSPYAVSAWDSSTALWALVGHPHPELMQGACYTACGECFSLSFSAVRPLTYYPQGIWHAAPCASLSQPRLAPACHGCTLHQPVTAAPCVSLSQPRLVSACHRCALHQPVTAAVAAEPACPLHKAPAPFPYKTPHQSLPCTEGCQRIGDRRLFYKKHHRPPATLTSVRPGLPHVLRHITTNAAGRLAAQLHHNDACTCVQSNPDETPPRNPWQRQRHRSRLPFLAFTRSHCCTRGPGLPAPQPPGPPRVRALSNQSVCAHRVCPTRVRTPAAAPTHPPGPQPRCTSGGWRPGRGSGCCRSCAASAGR